MFEWLQDEHPNVFTVMLAGWSYPDGELVALPFWSSCFTCGRRIPFRTLWCGVCDEERLARLEAQFAAVHAELKAMLS